jgi:hypothetical protein
VHRGKPYSDADLDEMIGNFNQSSAGSKPLVRVPAVLGHEENQEYLDRSDLPAAAWAKRIYREGHILKADFGDMPPKVTKLIKSRAYRTVSAEIYDDPPEGVPGQGKMLRRVAFLGGEIPQVKSLEDIPAPEEHGEKKTRWQRELPSVLKFREMHRRQGDENGSFHAIFSEVKAMDRPTLTKKLADLGYDTAVFDGLDDNQAMGVMAEILRQATSEQSPDGNQGEQPAPAPGQPPAGKAPPGKPAPAPPPAKNDDDDMADQYGTRCNSDDDMDEADFDEAPLAQGDMKGEPQLGPGASKMAPNTNKKTAIMDDADYADDDMDEGQEVGGASVGDVTTGATGMDDDFDDAGVAGTGDAYDDVGGSGTDYDDDVYDDQDMADDDMIDTAKPYTSAGQGIPQDPEASPPQNQRAADPETSPNPKRMGGKKFGSRKFATTGDGMPTNPPVNAPGQAVGRLAAQNRVATNADSYVPGGLTKHPAKVTLQYSEQRLQRFMEQATKAATVAAVEELRKELVPVRNQVTQFMENAKKNNVKAFCESRVKAGKIFPAEMERTPQRPSLFDRLMRADARKVVHKFKEKDGKTIGMTELDLQMAEIDSRKPFFFGERLKDPVDPRTAAGDRKARAEKFYEEKSHAFSLAGIPKEDFLKTCEKAKDEEFEKLVTA